MLNKILNLLSAISILIPVSLTISFIFLNVLTGCNSWSNDSCISPLQIISAMNLF